MIRTAIATLLSVLAMDCLRAQEVKAPPVPGARPHRWSVPPIEIGKPVPEPEASASGRLESAQPPAPPRPAPAPPSPTPVTTCDPGGCWDINGSRYNGCTSTMIRSDGKVCQQIGTLIHCN